MSPLLLVLAISVVVGLVMVVAFRYTSDQKAIAQAKDQLKAHLLAVRLFQDQLPVVMRAYGRIFRGTGRYLKLAFTPFLISILPVTFLIIQLDRYLGWTGLSASQPFLMEVRVVNAEAANALELQLPPELQNSAPAVHIPKDNAVVWRLVAQREGRYHIGVASGGRTVLKQVVVRPGLVRVSPMRLRGNLWERWLSSAEPALPDASAIQSIAVNYPRRNISVAGGQWNWIVLFFVGSLVAGFIFKSALGIQV